MKTRLRMYKILECPDQNWRRRSESWFTISRISSCSASMCTSVTSFRGAYIYNLVSRMHFEVTRATSQKISPPFSWERLQVFSSFAASQKFTADKCRINLERSAIRGKRRSASYQGRRQSMTASHSRTVHNSPMREKRGKRERTEARVNDIEWPIQVPNPNKSDSM